MNGSEYLKVIHGQVAGEAPALGLKVEKAVQKVVYEAIGLGYINAAHDCSEGGLAVALAECCMSDQNNMIGAKITLVPGIRADAALFGESQSRIIVTCKKENLCKIEELAIENNLVCNELGVVGGDNLEIANLINLPVEQLSQTWRSAIKL